MAEEIFFIKDDYSSFPTNDFIEINDNELESKVEITTEPTTSSIVPNLAQVWQFFEKKDEIVKDVNGNESTRKYIHCNINQCHLFINNSTTTLLRHLKSKHIDYYNQLTNKIQESEKPWKLETQKEKYDFLIN